MEFKIFLPFTFIPPVHENDLCLYVYQGEVCVVFCRKVEGAWVLEDPKMIKGFEKCFTPPNTENALEFFFRLREAYYYRRMS